MDANTKIYVNPTGTLRGRRAAGRRRRDRAGRSSSTPTAARPRTAAARSRARTRRRWTARRATWRATSRRTSSPPAWPTALLVQLAYAIGVADPVSVMVDTYGTGRIPDEQITELVRAHFKLTPARHHGGTRPAPADLQEDGRLRPLRPAPSPTSPGSAPTGRRPCRATRACRRQVRTAHVHGPPAVTRGRRIVTGAAAMAAAALLVTAFILPAGAHSRLPGLDGRPAARSCAGCSTSTRAARTARAPSTRWPPLPPGPACSSSSSPITATPRGRPILRPTDPASCASTPSKSARRAGTMRPSDSGARPTRWQASRETWPKTSAGSADSGSRPTRCRRRPTWRGATGTSRWMPSSG